MPIWNFGCSICSILIKAILLLLFVCVLCSDCGERCESLSKAKTGFTNSVGMEMIALDSGIYVSRYETRQREYKEVVGSNPSFHRGENLPVETVTAAEADDFCAALTIRDRKEGLLPQGFTYRLPSYEQWRRLVCDATIENSVTQRGIGANTPLGSTLNVGSGERNRLGLFDMRGNVSEFLTDTNYNGCRQFAGTSWVHHRAETFEIGYHAAFTKPNVKSASVGFRCILVPK